VGPGGGTHDVEFDGLDGGQVDDLEFLALGEAVGSEVFREALDARGGLHASGLIVGREVLDGLYVGYIIKGLGTDNKARDAPRPQSYAGSLRQGGQLQPRRLLPPF
jgi:hypothetical protein